MGQRNAAERRIMYRFFLNHKKPEGDTVLLTGADAHHIRDVLRMKKGGTFLLACGDEWEYTCEIRELTEEGVEAVITDAQKPGKELPSRITLLQCLPKGDKMETVIQKAVELGAAEIVPVVSSRCVVRLDARKAEAKGKRWNAIAESAAKQSKRLVIPPVHEVLGFREALQYAAEGASGKTAQDPAAASPLLLMPYENAQDMAASRRVFSSAVPGQPVAVLIGPEGGFSAQEAEEARKAGFQTITLGKRILRTETAGMAVLSILMYLLEET